MQVDLHKTPTFYYEWW